MQVWLTSVKFGLVPVLCCHKIAKQYQYFSKGSVAAAKPPGIMQLSKTQTTQGQLGIAMVTLSWSRVNAWRLSQHYLLPRADRQALLEVVTRIGGVHAQLMSAAELALWARVEDLLPTDVPDALWHDRSLIKTRAMRGTLHLLTASEFPLYVAARRLSEHRSQVDL